MTDRAETIIPTAADLVAAVRTRDPHTIERILTLPDLDWQALAVVLADNVGCVHDTRLMGAPAPTVPLTSPAVLTGGAWVRKGHILVWQAAS